MCSTASHHHRSAPSACPACVALSTSYVPVLASSWHAAERVCDLPQPHTLRTSTPGLRCTPSGSGSARRGRRRHRDSRLGDVAIGFSSVTIVPLFTIAIAITNGSCPEHPRFKAMAKPRTGARGQPRHTRRSRPLGYELTGPSLASILRSQKRRSRPIARLVHDGPFHHVSAFAPRFVPKSVAIECIPESVVPGKPPPSGDTR